MVNYHHGIAEVETWERFINEEEESQNTENAEPTIDELAKLRALLENSDATDAADTQLVIRKDVQKE